MTRQHMFDDDEAEDYCGATETEVIESLREDLESAEEQLRDQTARWAAVVDERDRLKTALEQIRDYHVIQGMSPALFAEKVLESVQQRNESRNG